MCSYYSEFKKKKLKKNLIQISQEDVYESLKNTENLDSLWDDSLHILLAQGEKQIQLKYLFH